jgi:hypothetical protein
MGEIVEVGRREGMGRREGNGEGGRRREREEDVGSARQTHISKLPQCALVHQWSGHIFLGPAKKSTYSICSIPVIHFVRYNTFRIGRLSPYKLTPRTSPLSYHICT